MAKFEDRNKRSVAAADVALPHRSYGVFHKGPYDNAPGACENRQPPKEGPYPGVLPESETSGYGQKRDGHMRLSGDPRAHQVGKR